MKFDQYFELLPLHEMLRISIARLTSKSRLWFVLYCHLKNSSLKCFFFFFISINNCYLSKFESSQRKQKIIIVRSLKKWATIFFYIIINRKINRVNFKVIKNKILYSPTLLRKNYLKFPTPSRVINFSYYL